MKNKGFTIIDAMVVAVLVALLLLVLLLLGLQSNNQSTSFYITPSAKTVPDKHVGDRTCERIGENENSFVLKCEGKPEQVFKKL